MDRRGTRRTLNRESMEDAGGTIRAPIPGYVKRTARSKRLLVLA